MNLIDRVSEQAKTRPNGKAIVEVRGSEERAITFAELNAAIQRGAEMLRATRLHEGEPVLILLPPSIDFYTAILSVMRAGMVAMPIDPASGRQHILKSCEQRRPRGIIAPAGTHLWSFFAKGIKAMKARFSPGGWMPRVKRWVQAGSLQQTPLEAAPPKVEKEGLEDIDAHIERAVFGIGEENPTAAPQQLQPSTPAQPEPFDEGPEDDCPAVVTFVANVTAPLGVIETHGAISSQTAALRNAMELASGEIALANSPIFVLANLAAGVASLICDIDFADPAADVARLMHLIQAHEAAIIAAPSALLDRLADACAQRNKAMESLTRIYVQDGPIFTRSMQKLAKMAPGAKTVSLYGSDEAFPVAQAELRKITPVEDKWTSVGGGLLAGRPSSRINLRILRQRWGKPIPPYDPAGFAVDSLGPKAPGEIVVSGRYVSRGHVNELGDEQTKFKVGSAIWHRTGDAGYLDEKGRLWVLGRCDTRIDDPTIYSLSVEAAAMTDPAVRRATFIQNDNKRLLEVEPQPGQKVDIGRLKMMLTWAAVSEIRIK